MHQMKKLLNIILTLWLFLLHPVLPSQWVDTLPSYSDPDGNPFQNVVVDHNNTGDVYVGGRNVLYHFSADLDLKQRVATGPMLDGQRSMDNHNSLLKMVYHLGSPPSLLFCGTAYGGNCQVIATTNLTESHWIHPHNDSVTRTGPFQSRAVFGLGYNDQWTLFTATTENQLSRASSSVPFLTSKLLTKEDDGFHFRYAFHNATTSSTLALKHMSERIVIDGGFAHETFIYFLLHIAQGGDLSSRLARFCTKEATFQSYAELALECIHEGRTLTLSTAMDFGDSPDSDEKSLYAIFDKPGGRSVLCVFPWSRIVESFTTSPRYCNRDLVGKPCAPGRKEIADFCGPDVTPYIISRPLVTNLAPFEIATKINVIIVLKQQEGMVAIVGSGGSSIMKLNLSTGAIISSNEMDQTIKRPFRSPFVLDQKRQNIYLLLENKIIKYPLSSCGIYATCRECLSRGRSDPLGCGWCGGERCTHPEECGETDLFSRHTCSPVITDRYFPIPRVYLVSSVTCVLGPAPVGTYGPVELSIATNFSSTVGYNVAGSATSEQNFTYYVGARLFGIRPNKGPTSGGTNVTLVGENLDFDNDKARLFIIRQRLCTFDRFSADRNTVYCITGNETKIEYPDTIAVLIGDATYALEENPPLTHNVTEGLSQTFQYTEDPKITQITPGITTKR
ncbi:hypothetical protein JTE90_018717 [Oedothorax gibbosus]|uniref:Sema domain-containing protein n=1 Tax=Oedothorax gibbosus TaxID=931172 RepID=A0AAV6U0B2_9ARAC|nr:hypothetical protein JTE90_018717 [Oedothorax gibbosus]